MSAEGESMKYIKEIKIKLDKNNYFVAIDFDRTITAKESSDSWDATGKLLGTDFTKRMNELYEKYRPIELDYKITFEEKNAAMEKWYQECMNLYYEYHLTEEKLRESIKVSNLTFRKGAEKFLETMHKQNVPVIILSAGIGNVIVQFLKENNCYYDNIFVISNFIEFDKNGNMKYFDKNMIHTLNKTMDGHLPNILQQKLNQRPYKLLFRRYGRR